jgi:osmotically-inducible protein OsmY
MSRLKKVSRDATAAGSRVVAKVGTRTGRRSTALSSKVGHRATAGWVAAKGAGRSLAGRKERHWPKRAGIAAAAGAAGGAAAFFRDPERRGKIVSKALSPLKSVQSPNDETIAERVRSEIFRPEDAPKGSVNVNVEQGVVYLRGEVADQERIQRLVSVAGAIPGVTRVESLLHAPGEEAANGSRSAASATS